MTVDQVMAEIERDVPFYDQSDGGVTISGGEPLGQPEFLDEILRACKQQGLHTALDTCGFAPWADLDGLRGDVDLFLYDLKLMGAGRHRECAGVSNEQILENLQRLSGRGHRIVLRVPVIPGVNDDDENLRQMGAFAAELPSLERVDLLPYHRIGRDKYRGLGRACTMPDTLPPSDGRMAEVAQALQGFDLRVNIGG
jgi:pyruvate formate lyase activating enzyme